MIPECFYRTSVKALILDTEKKVMLIKDTSGRWDFPGGGMDWGEDIATCLSREIREEMDLTVSSIDNRPWYFTATPSDIRPKQWFTNIFYLTKLEHHNFTPSKECIEIGFFSAETSKQINIYSNVKKFFQIYQPSDHS